MGSLVNRRRYDARILRSLSTPCYLRRLQLPTRFIGLQQQFFLLDTSRFHTAKLPPLTLALTGQQ
jgi:hypothetical protein